MGVVLATADLVVLVKGPQGDDRVPHDGLGLAGLEYDVGPEVGFGAAGEAWDGTDLEAVEETLLLEGTFKWL